MSKKYKMQINLICSMGGEVRMTKHFDMRNEVVHKWREFSYFPI